MRIAFIGLGRMGGIVCRNMLAAGHRIRVHDLADAAVAACVAAGATSAASVAEAVADAQMIFTSLPGPAEVRAVVSGAQGIGVHAAPGSLFVDLSTNAPSVVRELGALLRERGVDMLDAPVSGGVGGARKQALAVMVGGDEAAFERSKPVLACTATSVTRVGALGCGSIAKLVNNMLVFNTVTAAAEALTLGVAAGIDADDLDEVIRHSSGDSMIYRAVARKALRGDWSATFALDLASKDLHLALELADELDVPLMLGPQSHNLMRMARTMGYGEQDMAAVTRVFEQTLGVAARSAGRAE